MAHRIIGIDLGAYSVKVAVASSGFRQASLIDWLERPVPPPASEGEAFEERAARVLLDMCKERGLEHEVPYAALAGDALSIRVLDFPFQGLKRIDLDKAVGAELEAQLPHDLDELVYDFDVLPRDVVPPAAADDAKGAAAKPSPEASPGTRVLAAASTRERVERLLAALSPHGIEPHGVLAAPTAYARLAGKLAALAIEDGDDSEGVLLIDHGHARTNLCVVKRGRAVFARTLSRGGRNLTQAIARRWNLSFEDAEAAKHQDGFIASSRMPAPSEAWAHISEVLRVELMPLARDLRQTLAACRAQTGVAPQRAVVLGGGGRLQGLPGFLADELDLPVGTVTADDAARLVGPTASAGRGGSPIDTCLLAVGAALEGASGRPAFDLRKGPLAYKADFSFVRKKAGYLAACALIIVASLAGSAYASLHKLHKEEALLSQRLKTTTTEIFGKPMALEELEGQLLPKKEESPMPKMTAFDLLVEVSRRLPPKGQGVLDVLELEIEPKKIFIRAIADTSATIDEVEKKLKEIDCVSDIQRGKVDTIADGKQVSYTLTTKCM